MLLSRIGRRLFAEAAKSDQLVVRMSSPTWNILDSSTEVESIIYDSLDGGKGILNANFMITQTTLNPGVIEVHMKGGGSMKLVHVGGLIQKNADNSIDCALFEAYDKGDIDWEALKKSEAFAQEPVGDSSSEAEFLRRLGISLRDDIVNASSGL